MTRETKRASSVSRKPRHFMYSAVSKIFARSRGLVSSVQSSKPNMPAPAAETKGAKEAAAALEIRRSDSMSSGGPAARGAEFILVDFFEELALVELDGLGQVAVQLALGDVQHLDLKAGAGF